MLPSQGCRGNRKLVLRALMVDGLLALCLRARECVYIQKEELSGQLSWVWGGSLKSQPESQTYSAGRALSLLGIQHLSQDVLGQ